MSRLFQWIVRKVFGRRGGESAEKGRQERRVEAAGTFSEECSPSTPRVPDYLLAMVSPGSPETPEVSLPGFLLSATSPESDSPSETSVVADSSGGETSSEVSHLNESPEAGTPCIPLRYLVPADTSLVEEEEEEEEEWELRQMDVYLLEESDQIDKHRREHFLSNLSSLRLLLETLLFEES